MKRTRRIEIVRYTRRVTREGREDGDAPEADVETQAAALLLEALDMTGPAPGVFDAYARPAEGTAPPPAPRQCLLRRLTGWLLRD